MQSIKGYKFNTVEEADLAMYQLNQFYGLPIPNGISKFSSDSYFEIDNLYYIGYDEMLIPVLGEPIQIEVNEN
jgi:hypothetical protein